MQTQEQIRCVHGQNSLSKSQINQWFLRFTMNPVTSLKDLNRNGPRKLDDKKVQQIQQCVDVNRRKTVC